MPVEEIDNLKKSLDQAQKEKEGLELSLHNLTREKIKLQQELESNDKHIQKDHEALEKESLKRNHSTEGLLSATFNFDPRSQHLYGAAREIVKLNRWYEKFYKTKRR